MNGFVNRLASVIGSRRFYWAVLVFFVLEALWIAFSARYPMAFDEDFHLGVINIYAHHWSPFLSGQPERANMYGALAADPSYLYHYLMSLPYRLIAWMTDSLMAQVIILRLINIAFIASGLVLFRKVLLRAGASPLLTNTSTLLFVLIPTVPLLAGQINYDNLMLLGLAWVCWLVLKITEDAKTHTINLKTLGLLAVSLMLVSLVKYAFLPLALAAFVYAAVMIWRSFRERNLWNPVKKNYNSLSKKLRFGLGLLLVVSAGLFVQRYAVNLINYGHPVPDCSKVISADACMEYGPWGRNHRLAAVKSDFDPNPIAYTWTWLQGLHYRLFFVVNGPPDYTNYPPALLPSAAAVVIFLFGATALAFYWRQVFSGQSFLLFLLVMALVYAVSLWALQTYPQYVQTGQPVAINGRYFIPLLLPLAMVFGRALGIALKPWKAIKIWAVAAMIVLFLQGGGVFSFILRSDSSWYWPNGLVTAKNNL